MVLNRIARSLNSLLLLSLLFFSLQAAPVFGAQYTEADKQTYFQAIRDAEVATQDEVYPRLLAIVPGWDPINDERLHGSEIVWEGEPGKSRVLVGTFLDRASYEQYYKSNLEQHAETYELHKSLWVTVAPELKNYFIARDRYHRCPPTPNRIVQLLGLNPGLDYDVLIEMWVNPRDLFRPSPDPEITDHEAELAEKVSDTEWIFPSDLNLFVKLDASVLFKPAQWSPKAMTYKEWFAYNAKTTYVVGDESNPRTWGFPWTRLGYTYDWGNPKSPVGLSEFILRIDPNRNNGETIVKLHQAVDTASPDWKAYFRCRPEKKPKAFETRELLPEELN
jgi:hypothetical protein